MTVDEALAIAEVVLDGECLNDVQELIFRQCWEGRCSYQEIAKLSKYDDEYIKSIAAKLWKQLSDAFDEKVKKIIYSLFLSDICDEIRLTYTAIR